MLHEKGGYARPSLYEVFQTLPDPRRAQSKKFSLAGVLTLVVMALIAQQNIRVSAVPKPSNPLALALRCAIYTYNQKACMILTLPVFPATLSHV
jgi:hypothetical protein